MICLSCAQAIMTDQELPALARVLDKLGKKEPVVLVDGTTYCLAHIPMPVATTQRGLKR